MKSENRTLIIIAIVVVILLIVVGVATARANELRPPYTVNQPVNTTGNIIGNISAIIKKIFTKKTDSTSYVQVPPIDEQGCDANGYNAIGVKCF